ncbi:MAG: hypothetical protein HKN04_03075 [Rhodothermaceae bacterium]|nr:hypothetical protein [Rhodothermaceae bacterium]
MAASVATARAQDCDAALARAQDRYIAGAYEEVEALVGSCLAAPSNTAADSARAFRLQALAFLRLGDLEATTVEVLKLLGTAPTYEPDRIRDPPAYVGLVRFIRAQLQAGTSQQAVQAWSAEPVPVRLPAPIPQRATEASSVSAKPIPALTPLGPARLVSGIRLEGGLGANHYGGERGVNAPTWFSDLADNAGVGLQLGISVEANPRIGFAFVYEAGHYPTLLRLQGTPPDFEPLDREQSSKWLHQGSALVRVVVFQGDPVRPYAFAGVTGTVSRLNDATRVGIGPRIGVGAEGPAGRRASVFVEGQGTVVFSGRAVDLAPRSAYELLSALRIGVRYRLTR